MTSQTPTARTSPATLNTRLRDWAQLCRAPNLFTAMADPLAGALIAGVGWRDTGKVLVVMAASACFYAGGIVLNDWHDYRRDLIERPQRPLPSGRISRWRALIAAISLLAGGQLLASAVGPTTGGIGLLLVACILLYDILMKHIPIAPALMGACRSFNLALGMSLAAGGSGLLRWYLAVALGLYVLGITVFARRETGGAIKEQLLLGTGFMVAPLLMLALLGVFFHEQVTSATGGLWLALLSGGVGYTITQAILTPAPARIQRGVKTAVLGIIVFDAAMVGFIAGFGLSLLVVVLLVPAVWLGKWLYST